MIEKIIQAIVVIFVSIAVYWAFALIIGAVAGVTGFMYTSVLLAVIAGLLVIGVCLFVLRLFGVSL